MSPLEHDIVTFKSQNVMFLIFLTFCPFSSLLTQPIFYNVRNPSVSLSSTLTRNEKVEHYIRIKTHKPIALRFLVESGVSVLCG